MWQLGKVPDHCSECLGFVLQRSRQLVWSKCLPRKLWCHWFWGVTFLESHFFDFEAYLMFFYDFSKVRKSGKNVKTWNQFEMVTAFRSLYWWVFQILTVAWLMLVHSAWFWLSPAWVLCCLFQLRESRDFQHRRNIRARIRQVKDDMHGKNYLSFHVSRVRG